MVWSQNTGKQEGSMNVSELIKELKRCDPDTDVTLWDSCSFEAFPVDLVDIENSCEGQVLLTFNN
jgi:hypothetical protein